MQRSRRLFGVLIFAFWLLMMGFLLRREVGWRTLEPDAGSQRLTEPREEYFGVYLAAAGSEEGDRRVGQIRVFRTPQVQQGLEGTRLELAAEMRFQLLDKVTDLHLEGFVWRPWEVPRAQFEFAVRSADNEFKVAGEVGDGVLRGAMTSAGGTMPLEFPVESEVLFGGSPGSTGLGSLLSFPALEVGEEYRLDSFDPLTLSKGEARVRSLAREVLELPEGPVDTLRLEVEMSGIKSLAWVDEDGGMVRAETPVGLVIERLPEDRVQRSLGLGVEVLQVE